MLVKYRLVNIWEHEGHTPPVPAGRELQLNPGVKSGASPNSGEMISVFGYTPRGIWIDISVESCQNHKVCSCDSIIVEL